MNKQDANLQNKNIFIRGDGLKMTRFASKAHCEDLCLIKISPQCNSVKGEQDQIFLSGTGFFCGQHRCIVYSVQFTNYSVV